MRGLLLVLVFISTILPAQRDTLVKGIKFHLISDTDTGTSWIQFIKANKKGETRFSGWYLEYYRDGKVKAKGHYKNGKRSDDWTRYYPGGQIAEKGFFDGGYKSDLWQSFYESGKIAWKGNFFKGIRSGFWRYYYENGQLKGMTRYRIHTEKTYKKPKEKKGFSIKVNMEFTYSVSPADSLVEYYPDGKLRTRIIYGKEGGRNGAVDYYYENGQENMHGEYANGIQTGDWTWYCPDGSVSVRKKYQPDKKDPVEVKEESSCGYSVMEPWMKWEVEKITL